MTYAYSGCTCVSAWYFICLIVTFNRLLPYYSMLLLFYYWGLFVFGVIIIPDLHFHSKLKGDVINSYRYLGSWCNGETKTFRSRSCLAVRVNATSLNDRNNVIFTLKYKYTQQWSYGTTIRPTATMWPWMTSRPWATELPWGNGNPWMNHRPRTTANYWAMYTMSTRSPWAKGDRQNSSFNINTIITLSLLHFSLA